MLSVIAEDVGDVTILHCLGRIVFSDETAILCAAARQKGRNIVLDLAEVDAIDAAGVGALVALQAAGIYLKLMNPTQQVREILSVTQLDSIFEICESRSAEHTIESVRAAESQAERFHLPLI